MRTDAHIRHAQLGDYKEVAQLIVQAMEDLVCAFANTKDPKKTLPLFEHFFKEPKNQYSFEHTLIYEKNGEIAGSITAYDGGLLPQYRKPFLEFIAQNYGVTDLVIENETLEGELYIDTISVFPKFQGNGIGKKLLSATKEKAQSEGHKKIGLLVDYKNPSAKKLYLAMGFESVGKKQLGDGMYEHLQLQL